MTTIEAIAAVITAASVLITSIGALVATIKGNKANATAAASTAVKVDEIHAEVVGSPPVVK